MSTESQQGPITLDRAWVLHPQVAVRPEPFGALVYHFETRKLSFLKDRRLLDAVNALDGVITVRAALTSAGVDETELRAFAAAFDALAASQMIKEAA